jgi:hypothetical protein
VSRTPVEIIASLGSQSLGGFPGEIFDLVAEDIVYLAFDGHLYVGHEGLALFYDHNLRDRRNISFRTDYSRPVGEEWVLTKGDVVHLDRGGAELIQPGYWVARVRDGKVVAALYLRTEAEALAALPNA